MTTPSESGAERRRHARRAAALPVRIGTMALRTSNLSAGGVQLVCPSIRLASLRRAFADEPVDLAIALPEGEVVLAARLRYINEHGDGDFLVGIEFATPQAPDATAAIARYVEGPSG
ncbi:MAG: PilZ domain-containing protein [Ectothiorhodospiraceae bacterium]|nr:PilZ domain-containing protein [Chromatiales bacterium]MCP5157499.1 PilZ domain-containing protein [Ectothiorhodospiraceae bacterium]